ncbi:cell envelope integrity protein TolA [Vibrio europaeus]|nr:cell envelope integrity protein TolA [Vibrio europaeus]
MRRLWYCVAHPLTRRYVNGGTMRLFHFTLAWLLLGLSLNVTAQPKVVNEVESEAPSQISIWARRVHDTIQNNLVLEDNFKGQHVRYQVSIDILGNVTKTKILSSTGNAQLEKSVKVAILLAAPFDLSFIGEDEFVQIQTFNITIAPE